MNKNIEKPTMTPISWELPKNIEKPTMPPISWELPKKRKIVQIAFSVSNAFDHDINEIEVEHGLFALCNDGSLWKLITFNLKNRKGPEWVKIVDIPQD